MGHRGIDVIKSLPPLWQLPVSYRALPKQLTSRVSLNGILPQITQCIHTQIWFSRSPTLCSSALLRMYYADIVSVRKVRYFKWVKKYRVETEQSPAWRIPFDHQKHVTKLRDIVYWDVEDEDWLYSVGWGRIKDLQTSPVSWIGGNYLPSVYGLIAEEQEDVNRKYIESFLSLKRSSFVTL